MKRDIRRGRKLARQLPQPTVTTHHGVNIVTQKVEGLSAQDLAALSDYYRAKYGEEPATTCA